MYRITFYTEKADGSHFPFYYLYWYEKPTWASVARTLEKLPDRVQRDGVDMDLLIGGVGDDAELVNDE